MEDISLLSKGLSFAPTIAPNSFLLFKDLHKFIRKLTLTRFYNIQSNKDPPETTTTVNTTPDLDISTYDDMSCSFSSILDTDACPEDPFSAIDPELLLYTQHPFTSPPVQHTNLHPKSIFYPTRSKGPYIEAFYRVVFSDLQKMCEQATNKRSSHNLSRGERLALKNFTQNPDLIIKPADKGGGIVLQNKIDYTAEALRLLSDSNTYKKLSKDPLPNFKIEAEKLITTACQHRIIDPKEASFLKRDYYKTPYFYHLPKIHKDPSHPPGRPIVASMDSVTSGFSQYVDVFLQPLAQSLPSYIRDSTHLLERLSLYTWDDNYLWLSLDVNSLYTSIPHNIGLRALQHFLSQDNMTNPDQATFILDATTFCLTHNYFLFQGDYYLQTTGTAMGANFAPSYANLTMGFWETSHIWQNNPYIQHLIFYGRYIDDIIIIWDGPHTIIDKFVQHCNNNSFGLSFTSVWHKEHLAFLDLELGHEGRSIFSRNYTKPTAGNSYLHFNSCHHPLWVKNIPKGQFCRLRQNCTRDCDYIAQSNHLKTKFLEKGYPSTLIEQAFNTYLPGKPPKKENTSSSSNIRFITRFHGQYKRMESIISKHWEILKQDPFLSSSICDKPRVTYRRAPSLKNKIAPSQLKAQAPNPLCLIPLKGMYQCKKTLCKTCDFVQHGQKSFTHKGKTYCFDNFHNCSTDHVVYCLSCPCQLLYVGRTICPLRQRFGRHRRFIETGCDKHSVPRHFLEFHHQSTAGLRVWIIEAIPKHLPEAERFSLLCERETFWIYTLDSLRPNGLNEELDINTIL